MRRGYSREAYLDLVRRAREIIPDVTISTDIITGFSGETEEEHQDTLSLMAEVKYDQAFMFAHSDRETTHAARNYKDDVPEEIKLRRLQEVIGVFRDNLRAKNRSKEWGSFRIVLIEGHSTRSTKAAPMLTGRTDGNKRVIFPKPHKLLNPASRHLGTAQVLLERHFRQSVSGSGEFARGTHMTDCAATLDGFMENLSAAVDDYQTSTRTTP